LKDFVVVKDLLRQRVDNPSQQQKFTVNRVAIAVSGVGAAGVAGGALSGRRRQ
jgi:hypothetical protein